MTTKQEMKGNGRAAPRLTMVAAVLIRIALDPSTANAAEDALSAGVRGAETGAPQFPRIGFMVDVGIPDGATGSLAYRPRRWIRGHLGGSYNMISVGVRGGVTVVPFGVGPSFTLEGGHYFDGDANGVARSLAGPGYKDSVLLQRFGYDYATAHVGLEFGQRRVSFYIHGGVSYVRADIHNASAALASQGAGMSPTQGDVVVKQDPIIRAITPSLKLGLVVYLW